MPTNRFSIEYDEDYDVLFIYDKTKRNSHGIEWGNMDISYDSKGKLVSLCLNHATKLLTNLTRKTIRKENLRQINACALDIKEERGVNYLNFKFYANKKTIIEDTLPIKALNYCSPITAKK